MVYVHIDDNELLCLAILADTLLPLIDLSAQVICDARHSLCSESEVFLDVAAALLQEQERLGPKQYLIVYQLAKIIHLVQFFGRDLCHVAERGKFAQTRSLRPGKLLMHDRPELLI